MPDDTPRQEFLIPIHGFARYSDRELKIIDHPAFQRLFDLNQLGQTNLVYRGATHRRGEHALGAVAAAQLLIEALRRSQKEPSDSDLRWQAGDALTPVEAAIVRLSVLLHDIGHIVLGHTIEDELGLLPSHDSRARIEFVLDRTVWSETDITAPGSPIGETLRTRIDRLYGPEAQNARVVRNDSSHVLTASELVTEIITHDLGKESRVQAENSEFRVNILADIVGNTVCADLIDYLHRDWYHIGRPRFLDTRLFHYMEIRTHRREEEPLPPGMASSQIVVNLQSRKGRYRSDAVTAIVDLLESRYQLWEIALLHRTKVSATAMLERAVLEIVHQADTSGGLRDAVETDQPVPSVESMDEFRAALHDRLLEVLFEIADSEVYSVLSDGAWLQDLPGYLSPDVPQLSKDILWRLRYRILHKEVAHIGYGDYANQVSARLAPSKSKEQTPNMNLRASFEAASKRLQSLQILEDDFELKRGSLVMYCPSLGLGQKLAKIKMLHNDEVRPLNEFDSSREVSGGHLTAQLERFKQLWRASLFASPEAEKELKQRGLLGTLQLVFKIGVLGLPPEDVSMYDVAEMLTGNRANITYASVETLVSEELLAAYEGPTIAYPSGTGSLRSHFQT